LCGINGFTWKDESLIARMNRDLSHRGPDDEGAYSDGRVSLGHRRLSIIDLSPLGKQPMSNEDGKIWIVFNGEIYNFSSLREELEGLGHCFRSRTDTEVIIHSYEEWGSACCQRFNGMWAFAIVDKRKGELFLSRDRFGIKPLYYHLDGDGLIFSSEIRCILEHPIPRRPDDRMVYEYLAYGFHDHCRETFFSDVHRLMPGECLIYPLSGGQVERFKWYDLAKGIESSSLSLEDAEVCIRELFQDSVRLRLIADVPVGSCLSGGIDSSSIVYMMRRLLKDGRIKAFSMVFPGADVDESSYIDEVVEHTDVETYRITPTPEDLMRDLSDLVRTQEEPFATLSIYGQYRVMQLAHQSGMKVLLDGQGADEILAGYFIYFKYYIFESLKKGRLKEAEAAAALLSRRFDDLVIFPLAVLGGRFEIVQGIMERIWQRKQGYLQRFYSGPVSNPFVERGFDLNSALLNNLVKYSIPQLLRYEDKNSMRWSIESRVPFLDYRLVELALSLPSNYKIREGTTKYVFRRAMKDLVSSRILGRKDKIGFATPDKDWLANPALASIMGKVVDSKEFRSRKYWKPLEVSSMVDEHTKGIRNWSEELWRVLNLEMWLREFVDEQMQRPTE